MVKSPALPVPAHHPGDEPQLCIRLNPDWIPYLVGQVWQMRHAEFWAGSHDEIVNAQRDAQDLVDLLERALECSKMANGCCDGSDLLITVQTRITIDNRVEISIDGGKTWSPAPSDPQYGIPVLPAPVTAGVSANKCDAASNGKQHIEDVILGISENLGTAISVFEFAVAVAGVILEILLIVLTGGVGAPAAVQIAVIIWGAATAAFNAGKTAFDDYWTTDEKDKILCALYCNIGEDGTFTDGQYFGFLAKWKSLATPSIAFNMVYSAITATGAAGVNQYCAYGNSANADCSSCVCTSQTLFDLSGQSAGHLVQDDVTSNLWHYTVDTFQTNGYYGTVGFEEGVDANTFTLGVGGKIFWQITQGSTNYVFCVHKCVRGDTTFTVTDPIGQTAILQWYSVAPFNVDIYVLDDVAC